MEFQPRDPKTFEAALRRFDKENARDPNAESAGGVSHPRELLYAQRLTDWVLRLCPEDERALSDHRGATGNDFHPPAR